MVPSGSDATKTVQLLAACAAVAVVVAGLIGSAAAALSALLVGLVTWRVGARIAGITAGIAVILLAAEKFPQGASELPGLLASAVLLGAALAATHAIKTLSQSLDEAIIELSTRPSEVRRREPTPPRGAPVVAAPPRPQPPKEEQTERESRAELDVIHRFLRDARDALGADELMFWRLGTSDGELHPHSWASDPDVTPGFLEDAITGPLIQQSIAQRTIVANRETERSVFFVGPVGKGEQLHGVLAIHGTDATAMSRDRARRWLGRYASHLTLLLELLEEGRTARRYKARAQRFDQAVDRIQMHMNRADLLRAINEQAIELASATRSLVVLWEPDQGGGYVDAISPAHPIATSFPIVGDSLVASCTRDGQRFAVRDAYRMAPGRPIYGAGEPRRRIGSIGIIPLKRGDRVLGALVVEGDAASQITGVEVELLWQLSTVIAGALATALEMAKLGESAITDALTGLPNRRYFDQRMAQHLAESDRYGRPTSLILMDVDHFKKVNDTHGHQGGDAVLRQVAKVAQAGVRIPIDVCARFGGEELAIILPDTPHQGACEVAERLRKAVESSFTVLGARKVQVTASFGVATYPDSTRTGDQLFAVADRALYEAKAAGRNCVKSGGVTV